MKNILIILLLLPQIFLAQNGFEKGNELYHKNQFQDAVQAYESVLKTNKQSAELYFNLGNSYYKLNKVAPAIYNFEKALLLKPNDKDILNNLAFAQKLQIDEVKEIPEVGFEKVLTNLTSSRNYNSWAWVAVFGSFFILLFFIFYYFSHSTVLKRLFFGGMFLSLLVMLLALFAAISEKNNDTLFRPAIVFDEQVEVKSEPKADAPNAFILHEGTKVEVKENLDNWRRIALPDGADGWILDSSIKELK
ncbi:tetratricopeptide repeat protein [Flavobacterium sp. SM2513]|uniref:tetratricopeptide repeat protein n=1 Tax=Flavobacterium sp. SM2513 TaxID=3424766 RepID=UPI003D7F296D